MDEFSDDELLAYADEQLSVERTVEMEAILRSSESLRRRLAALLRWRDQGAHTVGAIWRHGRLSCPSRERIGSYLMGVLEPDLADYVDFHLRTVGCRYCAASLDDLQQQSTQPGESHQRRRRFFESSAGYVRPASSGR